MSRVLGILAGLLGFTHWSAVAAAAVAQPVTEVAVEQTAKPVPAFAEKPLTELSVEPERVALLTEHLDQASQLAAVEPFLPAIGGTLCAAGTVSLMLADSNEFHMSTAALLLPTTLCAAASFGSYLLPREYQGRIVQFAMLTSMATLLAAGTLTSPYSSRAEQVTILGLSGASAAVGLLGLIDAALERPVSWTTLANDETELRAHGTSTSRADVQRMESDLRHYAVRPIPRWAYGLTHLVGGAVAMLPAFVPSTSRQETVFAVGIGLAIATPGAINLALALTTDNRYEHYQKQLVTVRLSPLGPRGAAGLWASGTF
jgi:hypothetical protein